MISREVCQRVLQKAVSTGADYAEIFAENTVNHAVSMIANKVDSVKDTVIAGAAVAIGAVAGIAWRKAKKKVANALHIDENANKEVEEDIVDVDDNK